MKGIMNGIRCSSVVLCCITKKYTESKNCVREITFADQISKPLEILMCEKLKVDEIGEIGFIITPIVRHNLYKIPQIFTNWKGTEFDTILKCVKKRLRPSTGSAANRHESTNTHATQKCGEAEVTKAKGPLKASRSLEKATNCNSILLKIRVKIYVSLWLCLGVYIALVIAIVRIDIQRCSYNIILISKQSK